MSDILAALCVVADIGFQRASQGLSEMTGTNMEAVAAQVRRLPLAEVPALIGGPESVVVTIYLKIQGEIEGHMMLMLPVDEANSLAGMLLGEPQDPGLELSELARSALGEVGNITGAFFLTALADSTRLALSPSPPAVVVDMAGAILDAVLADLAMESDEVLVIDTVVTQDERRVQAVFLVLPRQRYLELLLQRLPR